MASTDPFAVDWYELQDNYALVSSGVLWTIDYLDTLPMEAAMFWNKTTKVTLPAIFYFVARYCTLFYAYMRISYLARGTVSNKFCADTSYPTTVALNVMELCTNMLLLLRAYAIAGKNRAVLALGTTLILARTIYGLYINLTLEIPIAGLGRPFDPRCTWIRQNNSHETLFQRYTQFVTPALALALDTLVFLAIITPTFSTIVDMRKLRRTGFIDRVVRDGALHYAVVLGLAVCLAVATISVIDGNATKALNSMGQIIAPFFNLVPNIIASRIFLNTHTYANMDKGNAYETMTSMSFAARAMGSIGAPLQSELCGDSFETDPTLHSSTVDSDGQHETGEAMDHGIEEMQTSHQHQHENIAVIATTSGNAGISYEVV